MSRRAESDECPNQGFGVTSRPYHRGMKQCPGCGEIKPLDAFYTNPGGRDGRRPECKQCTSRLRMERYRANREAEIARVTKWQRQNAGRIEAYQARYRQLRRSDDRAGHLRRKFGLTLDECDAMLGGRSTGATRSAGGSLGRGSICTSITTMTQGGSAGCCASAATWRSATCITTWTG